ncbi:uncharacterized protein METZ01_LOCUS48019, partial [marine metagenome]
TRVAPTALALKPWRSAFRSTLIGRGELFSTRPGRTIFSPETVVVQNFVKADSISGLDTIS